MDVENDNKNIALGEIYSNDYLCRYLNQNG